MANNLHVTLYPESFMQLVKKLEQEHEDLWCKVGHNMAHKQLEFIRVMNEELDVLCLPEEGIDAVCIKYLKALQERKGKAATKSFELIHAERTGRFGAASIFGTPDDDGERLEVHNWKRKKGLIH